MSPKRKLAPTTSGHEGAGSNAIEDLKTILQNQTHLFACGGMIPIAESDEELNSTSSSGPKGKGRKRVNNKSQLPKGDEQKKSTPITIRWDLDRDDEDQAPSCTKLTLPLAPGADADMDRLVQHSQPATFGRGGKNVYDESYRKALKMDTTKFCSTFDPYALGIIDAVAQVLLPSVIDSTTLRAVRAELYKLNVYSAPSGKFKAHVDTPRSREQFGSLVVCLPVDHEGGQLKVRHKNEEMTFDWSTNGNGGKTPVIHWAAFYSDCEHEVLEVTSGHRLTLTYNLYVVRGAGRLTGVSPTLDPTQLPLFQAIKNIIGQDPFDGKGGTLGFWCSHVYAYNDKSENPLPDTLKGVDAVLWESLRALKLRAKIAPVMAMDEDSQELFEDESEGQSSDSDKGVSERDLYKRRYERELAKRKSIWIVGHKFGLHVDTNFKIEDKEEYDKMYRKWGDYMHSNKVQWLTEPNQSELQLVYKAYGNEASVGTIYSSCAILVPIPAKKN